MNNELKQQLREAAQERSTFFKQRNDALRLLKKIRQYQTDEVQKEIDEVLKDKIFLS